MSLLNVSLLLCCVNKLAKVLAGRSLCLASLRGMHLSLGSLKVFLFFFSNFVPDLFSNEDQSGTVGFKVGVGFHGFEHLCVGSLESHQCPLHLDAVI